MLAWEVKIKVFILFQFSHSAVSLWDPMDCSMPGSFCPWDFPGKNTGVGCHFLLQGIFLTQGSNLHLLWLLQADSLPLIQLGSPSNKQETMSCIYAILAVNKKNILVSAFFASSSALQNKRDFFISFFVLLWTFSYSVQQAWIVFMTKRKICLTTIPPQNNPWKVTGSGETANKNAHPPYNYCIEKGRVNIQGNVCYDTYTPSTWTKYKNKSGGTGLWLPCCYMDKAPFH